MAKEDCKFSELTPSGVTCPECKEGELNPARGRFGPVYKCTHKGCKFWIDSRPTGENCTYLRSGTECGALIVEGTKTIPDRCSDRSCPNRNPHKLTKR